MTTLDNGIVVDEQYTAEFLTRGSDCLEVFGVPRQKTNTFIHHWGVDGQTHDAVTNFLRTRNSRQVSAHFVVSEGRVTCLVSPNDAAWHTGNGVWNARSIGIECRPEMSPGDIEALCALLRFIEDNHGEQSIYIHKNVVNTDCPGRWEGAIDTIISKINGGPGTAIKPIPGGGNVSCRCN